MPNLVSLACHVIQQMLWDSSIDYKDRDFRAGQENMTDSTSARIEPT